MEKNNNENSKRYVEKVTMFMSGTIAILIMIAIGYMLHLVIPNELDIQHIQNNYIHDLSFFVAEKSERMQYIVLTISFPIIYICVYKLLQKINNKIPNCKIIYNIFSILNVFVIIGLLFWTGTIDRKNLILGRYISTIQIIISCYIGAMILVIYGMVDKKKKLKIFLYSITTILIGIVSYLYVNPTFGQEPYISYHVDAYYYPILKITSGLTPYIDFTPIYGCYSYVLAFILSLLNNNSLMIFSIIQTALIAIVLTNFSITIYKNMKNKGIGFITIIAMIFSMIIYTFTVNKGQYLQYGPHRVLFVSIILLFITIYLKYRNTDKKNLLQIVGYIIAMCSLFWNIETGLVVLIVWTGFLGYEILFFNSLKDKKTYFSILKIFVMAVISALITYFIIFVITYLRTGLIIDIKNLIASQTLFYKEGYYMLKMPLRMPWLVLIYIYVIGLAISLRKLYFMNSEKRLLFNKYAMIFILSILGVGIFSYYQGRSHISVFLSVTYPGIMLIGIFTDILLEKITLVKVKKYQISNIIIVCMCTILLSLLATSTVYSLISDDTIKLHFNKEELNNITVLEDFSEYDTSNMEFITDFESLYYDKYNLKDTKKFPAKVDLFTYKDCEKVIKFLKETDKDIVIDYSILQVVENRYKEDYKDISNKFTINRRKNSRNIVLINKK